MFKDRKDAGQQLARALQAYQAEDTLVLAIPKGGIEVGCEVAEALGADFSIIITRKLPFPDNPESGFGAIAEDGSAFIFDFAKREMPDSTIQRIRQEQQHEIARRKATLRQGHPLPQIQNRTVILVDDGIAMGSTMRTSISLCQRQQAQKIIVAAPVAGANVIRQMRQLVDDMIILETPPFFRAVAQVYANWYDVPDQEARELLKRCMGETPTTQ